MNKKQIFIICIFIISIIFIGNYETVLKYKQQRAIDSYPNKPIEIIVAYKEGGGTDIGARILASVSKEYFNHPLIVRNIEGGDGEVGFNKLANAKPDGYTIGFINLPTFLSLMMERDTQYSKENVIPIMNYVYDPAVLVVRRSSQWKTIEDFINYSKNNPLNMTISNNGVGASNHIAAAYLAYESNIEVTHVPFGGTADMIKALRYGYVKASVAKISEVANLVESGELRILASFTESRLEGFVDVPTLKEKEFDVLFGSARALVAPKDTPQEIVDVLHKTFKQVIESEEHIKQAKENNLPINYMSPLEVEKYIEESEKYLERIISTIEL